MESKLEHLIEKIKSDGIDEARKAADEILARARSEADQILAQAREEADRIISESEKRAQKTLAGGEAALRQAARDAVLTTREQMTSLLDRIFKREIANALDPDFLKELIARAADHFDSDVEVLVGEKDRASLKDFVLARSRDGLEPTVTFKVDGGISRGFRIGLKDGDVHYDFTDASILEFLSEFLNPAIREILDKE